MFKNFFKRNKQVQSVTFAAQEIWWCAVGAQAGLERPVLVFRKFNGEMFWGLPLSAQRDAKTKQLTFSLEKRAALSQMRILHAKRLVRRLGKVSDKELSVLNKAIMTLIQETNPLRDVRPILSRRVLLAR